MELSRRWRRVLIALIIISIFASWVYFLHKIPPTELLALIGVKNSYLLSFILALIGGTSLFFPFPYPIVVFTFAAGGSNPILLGIFAGAGAFLGDSTSYFLGYSGREILPGEAKSFLNKFSERLLKRGKPALFFILLVYSSLSPFSNDFLVMPLGLARFPYWKTVLPLWLGNTIFNTLIALSGFYGFHYFFLA